MDWELFLDFLEKYEVIVNLAGSIIGGGVVWQIGTSIWENYNNNHKFDIIMDKLNQDNALLAQNSGTYVSRKNLEDKVNKFVIGKCHYCNITGAAGSGKTRLALNILKSNGFFSRYYYVFINKNNARFLDEENLYIEGRRNYVFIFDYVYENKERIKSMIELAKRTGRHKFIFLERDYTGLPLPCDYEISMKDYSMSIQDLTTIFLNKLRREYLRIELSEDEAAEILKKIYGKLDKEQTRPIIAILLADIYSKNKEISDDIETMSDLIKSYWEYKFDSIHIEDIGVKYKLTVDSVFMSNLDRLVRSLLLITAVTKRAITVKFSDNHIFYKLEGYDTEIGVLIDSLCDNSFINTIATLHIDCIIELFGKLLKEQLIVKRSGFKESFTIVSELDIVSEWLLYDILRYLNISQTYVDDLSGYWGNKLRLFLENHFPDDYKKFMSRAAIDFDDMVEFYGYMLSDNMDINEYILHINDMITLIYGTTSSQKSAQALEKLDRYIGNIDIKAMDNDQYKKFVTFVLENFKVFIMKHENEEQITTKIYDIYQQRLIDIER